MSKLTKRMEKLALLAGGSFKTVHDRLRIAGRLSQHLHMLNIQIQDLQHLKSSHIESYVMARREAGITPRTLQNEMAALGTGQHHHYRRICNRACGFMPSLFSSRCCPVGAQPEKCGHHFPGAVA